MKLESLVLGIAIVTASGCASGEWTRRPEPSPRDVYASTVRSDPAVLRGWENASRRALRSGLSIAPSFRERVRFPASQSHAVGYRFNLVRGQSLRVQIVDVDGDAPLFADIFQDLGGNVFRPVQSADRSGRGLRFAAPVDGAYVLRIQPRIGRGGTYDVTVLGDAASLVFPVAGGHPSDIGSRFGDARDGGARAHEGVDIFAPRGTPVVAAADGYIEQSRNTPTGGLVIWQRDRSRALTYYYAHLDELIAREGTRVSAGDTIGRVGNTGNARGTRPHLHFGIYRPGTVAVDPAPMLARTMQPAYAVLDRPADIDDGRPWLRASPSVTGVIITELSPDTPLLVLGDTGAWQRVVLPDGTTGFVAERHLESTLAGSRRP